MLKDAMRREYEEMAERGTGKERKLYRRKEAEERGGWEAGRKDEVVEKEGD
jgi:hypothetical protein